jgi:hypothetical protein
MWRNLEHVTGAYSEHAKAKRYTQRRAAWGDAHRAAGSDAPRERHQPQAQPPGAAAGGAGVSSDSSSSQTLDIPN